MTSAALSPDGREAAGDLVEGTKLQVWILDLERGARRLLVRNGDGGQPIWSRDGKFITYVGMRGDEHGNSIVSAPTEPAPRNLSCDVTRWPTPLRLVSGRPNAPV